jgi:flagellar motor switch protein FliG
LSRVFSDLDDSAPEVAETIRNLMLTFEDLIRLDNRGLQLLLKEVAREDLMLALKTASPAMQEKVFANISARAAEILQEDMSTMGPVRLKDVEKAQANIITVARRLAEEQKIQLGGGGDDALV